MPFASRMKPEKKYFARQMRKNPTPSEAALWQALRCRRLDGLKFRRQARMLGYIADFYCASVKLVVEVDGSSHDARAEYDCKRDHVMLDHGIIVLRVQADKVMSNLPGVLSDIRYTISRLTPCIY